MIDTIKLKIDISDLPYNYRDYLISKLSDLVFTEKKDVDFKGIRGFLKNLKISLDPYGLIIQGSLTKYLVGNNLGTLFLEEIKEGIIKLNEDLQIDCFYSKVMRVDVATNIITKYPTSSYTNGLIAIKYTRRLDAQHGVYFRNGSRCICIYDKIKELKKQKHQLDDFLSEKNILRMEYRLLNNESISKLIGVEKAKLKDVLNNYSHIVNEWGKVMREINSSRSREQFSPNTWKDRKSFDEQLMILGIRELGGLHIVFKIIESAKAMNLLSKYPNEASNLKSRYRKIITQKDFKQQDFLGKEVDEKVKLLQAFFNRIFLNEELSFD